MPGFSAAGQERPKPRNPSANPRGFSTRQVAQEPDIRTLQQYLDSTPVAFLECRDKKHGSDPYDVEPVGRYLKETVRCPRCGTLRSRLVDSYTGLAGPWKSYNHPNGYLRKGHGRMTKLEVGRMRLVYLLNR
jgi:hypothetical protein